MSDVLDRPRKDAIRAPVDEAARCLFRSLTAPRSAPRALMAHANVMEF